MRVYLVPGMEGTAQNFLTEPVFKNLTDRLVSLGYDVVILNTPLPAPCWFADGGNTYRGLFLHELDYIVADASAKHGQAAKALLSGISYGGLHALIGYASRSKQFIGWQAGLSVTKLSALDELKNVGDVRAFSPFNQIDRFHGSSGLLTWGEDDMRVDHREAEKLYALIRSPTVVGIGYPNAGHETTPSMVDDLLKDAQRQAQIAAEK